MAAGGDLGQVGDGEHLVAAAQFVDGLAHRQRSFADEASDVQRGDPVVVQLMDLPEDH